MANGITLGKLAELAGVSPATVSIVLNRRPLAKRIPDKTQEKIHQLASKHNYHPNQLAKAMKSQSTGIIGFICGDINMPYYAELCSELTFAAEKRGYNLMAMLTQWSYEKEINALERLFSRMVDGVIIISNAFSEHNKRTDNFRRPGVPLVTMTDFKGPGVCAVFSNYLPGMDALFTLLTANGYRRIALADYSDYPLKYEAYKACAIKHGISEQRFDARNYPEHSFDEISRGIRLDLPEVLICSSDYVATQIISRLALAGLRIPEDISVVSIDGTQWSESYNPPLTAIKQDIPGLAEASLDILFGIINGNHEIIEKSIPTTLSVHKSVKLFNPEFTI